MFMLTQHMHVHVENGPTFNSFFTGGFSCHGQKHTSFASEGFGDSRRSAGLPNWARHKQTGINVNSAAVMVAHLNHLYYVTSKAKSTPLEAILNGN